MIVPFDIKYRPEIESGKYKVETRDGRPVTIISWDVDAYEGEIAGFFRLCAGSPTGQLYNTHGKHYSNNEQYDLYIVGEMTEFEERLKRCIDLAFNLGKHHPVDADLKSLLVSYVGQLLPLATDHLRKTGYAVIDTNEPQSMLPEEPQEMTLVGGEDIEMKIVETPKPTNVEEAICGLIGEIDGDYCVVIHEEQYKAYIKKYKDIILNAAKKEIENQVAAAGPRGPLGDVPQDIMDRANEYRKKVDYPYDSFDIGNAYSIGAMDERKLNEK